MYRNSYWETDSLLRAADVIVVGGGLTGLQTAIGIKTRQPSADILLLERASFSRGASTRNAGFACFGSPTEILEDLENGNADEVWETVSRRYAGIRKLEEQYGHECNYKRHGGYELFYPNQPSYRKVITALPALNQAFKKATSIPAAWEITSAHPNIQTGCGLIYCRLEGQLHPGKLVDLLIRKAALLGIRMLNGMEVARVGIDQGRHFVEMTGQTAPIFCEQLILATNAFTKSLMNNLSIQPARNQVIISKPIAGLQLRGCFHHERGYVYFRNVGNDRLLIGGARHLAGAVSETTEFGANPDIQQELTAYLERAIDLQGAKFEIDRSWSGIIAQGGKSPIVRKLDSGIIVAARLSGMGVALSAQVAEEAVALVL